MSYGVTINAASLVEVSFAGTRAAEIAAATTARIIAEREAEALVATAKGEANAARERARGQADAIKTVYDQVQPYGQLGLALRQIEALEKTAGSPNHTSFVWANNPLDNVAKAMENFGRGPQSTPPPPPPPSPSTS
jgi:regulator of protease activity HflC (stomatin/prohibitin superfamily)